MKRKKGKRTSVLVLGCLLLALCLTAMPTQASSRVYYDDQGNTAVLVTEAENCTVSYWPEGEDPANAVTVSESTFSGQRFSLYELPPVQAGVVYRYTVTCEKPEGFVVDGKFVTNVTIQPEPVMGKVVDGAGNPVPGALVLVRPSGSRFGSWATTDESGQWTVHLADMGNRPRGGASFRVDFRGGRHMAAPNLRPGSPGAGPSGRDLVLSAAAEDGRVGATVAPNDGSEKTIVLGKAATECVAHVCNVYNDTFATFWESEFDTSGYIEWGTSPDTLDATMCDTRDRAHEAGECHYVGDVHFVQVEGLSPETTYYFQVYEGDLPKGDVCSVTTGPELDPMDPDADINHIAFGKVMLSDGVTLCLDSVVMVQLHEGDARSAPQCVLSAVVGKESNWAIEDGLALTEDLQDYFHKTPETREMQEAFGAAEGHASQEVLYPEASPSPTLVLSGSAPPVCSDEDGDGYAVCDGTCDPGDLECGDCDDASADVNPGAAEVCDDGIDNDCDGAVDAEDDDCAVPACPDEDGDGYAVCDGTCDPGDLECGDCDDASADVNPGAAEVCDDGIDNDCDGAVDAEDDDCAVPACPDEDGDGYAVCDGTCDPGDLECGDCDDANAGVNPGAAEVCDDGIDNDCDGLADGDDPDCAGPPACPDNDGDGYAVCDGTCDPGDLQCGDCDDTNACVNPGRAEVCDDGIDNDCDGAIDTEDSDCPVEVEITPLAPPEGAGFTTCSEPPTFSWTDGGFTSFYVTMSTAPDFSSDVLVFGKKQPFESTSWTPTPEEWFSIVSLASGSAEDLPVYWMVTGVSDTMEKPGLVSHFVILAQAKPVPTAPKEGTVFTITSTPPTFTWEPGDCNGMFRLEFSLSPDFEKPIVLLPGVPLTTNSWTPPSVQWRLVTRLAAECNNPANATVYWRVVAWDNLERVTRSDASNFVVELPTLPPRRPVRRPFRP